MEEIMIPAFRWLSFAAAAVLCAFAPLSASAAAADSRPELVVAVAEIPEGLEPSKELSNMGTRITYNIFDTLIRRDFLADGSGTAARLVPGLAESWKRIDNNGIELHLRKGVKFHNGDELTADDVVFTFERMLKPDYPAPEGKAYFSIFDRLEAVDPYTVRIYTKYYDTLLEHRLSSWASWIVNKRAYEKLGFDGFGRAPVGTGPYKLKSLRSGESIVLDANDEYYGGKPTARRVTFRMVPEVAARISGLVSGEFDIIANLPPDQTSTLAAYPDIDVRSVVLSNTHMLVFNTSAGPLKDKRIRQALSFAVDRKALNDALWGGKAVIPNGHQFPEFGDMYDPSRPGQTYDPEKARTLVKEAGYHGEPIVMYTQANYYVNALSAAQIMQEMWKAVGLNVRLQVIENWKAVKNDDVMIRNWSNSNRYPDPLGSLAVLWGANGAPQASWKTWAGPAAEAFNKLIAELERTSDTAARKVIFGKMLDLWEDETPGMTLYQPLESYGVKKSVHWQPYSFYYMDLRPYNLSFSDK